MNKFIRIVAFLFLLIPIVAWSYFSNGSILIIDLRIHKVLSFMFLMAGAIGTIHFDSKNDKNNLT